MNTAEERGGSNRVGKASQGVLCCRKRTEARTRQRPDVFYIYSQLGQQELGRNFRAVLDEASGELSAIARSAGAEERGREYK